MAPSHKPFGKYHLLEKLAMGGMAEIFLARNTQDPNPENYLAIKRILPHYTGNGQFVDMFIDEAKLTIQLSHPNIVPVFDLGRIDDHYFLAMEYVAGQDLKKIAARCAERGVRLAFEHSAYILAELLKGLDHAHAKTDPAGRLLGIVHRDVSPQNILVGYDGTVKITDFGIAKASAKLDSTQAGTLKGKFGYMAPEQVVAGGPPLDRRSDVFTAGIVLWELITGQRLFDGKTEVEVLERVRKALIEPPSTIVADVPRELERVVFKALIKDPAKRYQTAQAMAADLTAWLDAAAPGFGPPDLQAVMEELFPEELEYVRAKWNVGWATDAANAPPEVAVEEEETVDEEPAGGPAAGGGLAAAAAPAAGRAPSVSAATAPRREAAMAAANGTVAGAAALDEDAPEPEPAEPESEPEKDDSAKPEAMEAEPVVAGADEDDEEDRTGNFPGPARVTAPPPPPAPGARAPAPPFVARRGPTPVAAAARAVDEPAADKTNVGVSAIEENDPLDDPTMAIQGLPPPSAGRRSAIASPPGSIPGGERTGGKIPSPPAERTGGKIPSPPGMAPPGTERTGGKIPSPPAERTGGKIPSPPVAERTGGKIPSPPVGESTGSVTKGGAAARPAPPSPPARAFSPPAPPPAKPKGPAIRSAADFWGDDDEGEDESGGGKRPQANIDVDALASGTTVGINMLPPEKPARKDRGPPPKPGEAPEVPRRSGGRTFRVWTLLLVLGVAATAGLVYAGIVPNPLPKLGIGVEPSPDGGPSAAAPDEAAATPSIPEAVTEPPRVEAALAEIPIDSDPPGASVAIDGTAQEGRTPLTVKVPVGRHAVTLTLDGHQPLETTLEVTGAGPGKPIKHMLVKAVASMRVVSVPAGAKVFADGEYKGLTPVTLEGLEPGKPLMVNVSHPGYRKARRTQVPTGNPTEDVMRIDLKPVD